MNNNELAKILHEGNYAKLKIEDILMTVYEKYEPGLLTDSFDFEIDSDFYDNSLEVYFKCDLPYPYEPCREIREAMYNCGFDIVYWNFIFEKDGVEDGDEIRGYEPRHNKDSKGWVLTKYGYVDDRFNEKEWLKKYNFKNKE